MRIEAYNQVQQIYAQNNTTRQMKTDVKGSFSDQLQISNAGKDIQIAKKAVNAAPDIRENLVESIRNRISNGSYSVDSESLADKLIAGYSAI